MSAEQTIPLFIHGAHVTGTSCDPVPLQNPANEETIGTVVQVDEAALHRALGSAMDGFATWSATSAYDRSAVMRRAAALIRDRLETLAPIMTQEQGKPLTEARAEWNQVADCLEWAAEEGRRAYGRVIPSRAPNITQAAHRFPIGPVAAFAPWNFPGFSPTQKIAPALAAGCSMILKPATDTPGSAVAIAEILSEAGLPPGALNVVHGKAAFISETLIAAPQIRKVSLTGSVEVGRQIAALAGKHLKKCTMELGGHAPVLVFADADVDRIAPLAAAAKYRNAGQICTSPTRFIVEAPVYDAFVDRFVAVARDLAVGDGMDPATQMGPLVSARQVDAMSALVADARGRGGRISCGGARIGNAGAFFAPTVIEDAPDDARVHNEEPFGPIAVMSRFNGVEEAISRANALPYGLASYAFTYDSRIIDRVTRGVEAGLLAFNQFRVSTVEGPFGGVKDSGFGSEGGIEGIDGYLHSKFVSHFAT